ncbi:MAG: peptidoglycan recognition protein family protein [Candidatus Thiodiazotropha sp. (ex Monitilora ramsayi)]|nr:peptidoglycan recognition protein family protein [Candidatus Thiodiazotropha sp. (ex Monitilora ramsayi)]
MSSLASLAVLGVGGLYWQKRWKYIVIHHSGGSFGTIEFLQKVHRERQANDPIDAIPYHYIIGNGNGLREGEVASDWRQELGIWGAHVSGRNTARNMWGIGICLIGNYEMYPVPELQYNSLVSLTKSLMSEYNISVHNVTGHGHIEGEQTKCPGKLFPMEQFKRDIA